MPAILENDYVIASAYVAQGYAKFILNRDVAGAIQDVIVGLKKAGLDSLVKQAHTGFMAGMDGVAPPPL